jgi:hypothetical protein
VRRNEDEVQDEADGECDGDRGSLEHRFPLGGEAVPKQLQGRDTEGTEREHPEVVDGPAKFRSEHVHAEHRREKHK